MRSGIDDNKKTDPLARREDDTDVEPAEQPAGKPSAKTAMWRESKTEIDTAPPAALAGDMLLSGEIAANSDPEETIPTDEILLDEPDTQAELADSDAIEDAMEDAVTSRHNAVKPN